MYGYHPYWGMGWMMGIGIIIFWILVIIVVVYLIRYLSRGQTRSEKEETALDILKKRYAGGEIAKEEFDRTKRDLEE
jgi:putative membrane protein